MNLTDIFQTLAMNRQTGTLHVTSGGQTVQVHVDLGQIVAASAPLIDGRPYLLNAMVRRGLLAQDQADELVNRLRTVAQPLRALILASAYVNETDLDGVCVWCIEEMVCPIFTWTNGDFAFVDGPFPPELQGVEGIELGGAGLAPTHVILEATRRGDEWKRIRAVIPDDNALYIIDNEGRPKLKNLQTDPDMLKVVRYLDGRHSLRSIARHVGVTEFDTFAIVAQLIAAGVARALTPQEIVDDAAALRHEGEPARAREMLEIALSQARIPEVLRPLAECCALTQQAPRAVEIYLELIQIARDGGDLEQALADLNTVIGLSPDDPELHADCGQLLAELGRGEEGSAAFCSAAQAYLAVKDVAHAIDACHRAKNLVPRAPDPHRYLARAYLLDGQTENAVVEYKALWHALLTTHSPRKALEELQSILNSDCKFQAIKDQVLAHAHSSEAVKTSRVVRWALVAVITALFVGGGMMVYDYISKDLWMKGGLTRVNLIKLDYSSRRAALAHSEIKEQLGILRTVYAGTPEVTSDIDKLVREIDSDWNDRARQILSQAEALNTAGRFQAALAEVAKLKDRFRDTPAAVDAESLAKRIREARYELEVGSVIEDANRLWKAENWDAAIERLKPVAKREDLPPDMAKLAQATWQQWSIAIANTDALIERAERIAVTADPEVARVAFQRAAAVPGDATATARARSRLAALERTVAERLVTTITEASAANRDQEAFAALAKLETQAKETGNPQIVDLLSTVPITCVIAVDHARTTLAVARARNGERPQAVVNVGAPAGTVGRWTYRLTYAPAETVTVTAQRSGFSLQTLIIAATQRRTTAGMLLVRGPSWRRDVGAMMTTAPFVSGANVIYGTNRASVMAIDVVTGGERTIAVDEAVASIAVAPQIREGRMYVGHEDRVICYDVASRARRWVWPDAAVASTQRFSGFLAIDRNELVQDRTVIFAVTGNTILTLGVNSNDRVIPYPKITMGQDIHATPFVERSGDISYLGVPSGSELRLFDISLLTEVIAPAPIGEIRSRGELVGRAVRTKLSDRPVWLICDGSGQVVAFDLAAGLDPRRRLAAVWPIEGSPQGVIELASDAAMAWITTNEGRVYCLDLKRPGTVRWRYPQTGTLAGLTLAPASGQRALYIADATHLTALDPTTGVVRWRAELPAPAVAAPAFNDGHIVVPLKNQILGFEEGEE